MVVYKHGGDRYDRYNPNGEKTDQVIKFDDGTEYKDKSPELLARVYSKENTKPGIDPVDLTIGSGISSSLLKSPATKFGRDLLTNIIDRIPTEFLKKQFINQTLITPEKNMIVGMTNSSTI